MKHILLCAASSLLISSACLAQDIHFTQFQQSSILRNPGLVGIFKEGYKVQGMHRSQWASVAEPYTTTAFNAELRFPVGNTSSDYLSVGMLGYTDDAGLASMKTNGIYPALNFSKLISHDKNVYLSAGFTGGYVQRSYDPGQLSFDNEFSNGVYIPHTESGEELPATKLHYWDLGAGLSLNGEAGADGTTKYFAGVAGYHYSSPTVSFTGSQDILKLSTRWNLNLGLNTPINPQCRLQLHANYSLQLPYNEVMLGALLQFSRPEEYAGKYPLAFFTGLFYRHQDAVAPMVALEYRMLYLALSYDINISSLREASQMRGGLEICAAIKGILPEGHKAEAIPCPSF